MKIGKFANLFNVSIDTVRHYMDLNLIIPFKRGSHYYFDELCNNEMQRTLELKDMGFSLSEIKKVISFKRLCRNRSEQELLYYKELFMYKERSLLLEIEQLKSKITAVKQGMNSLDLPKSNPTNIKGVPLNIIKLFACNRCQSLLKHTIITQVNNEIIEGTLSCICGEKLLISNGVIISRNTVSEELFSSDAEYIMTTNESYLDMMYKALKWTSGKVKNKSKMKGNILELGCGIGMFLSYIYDNIHDDSIYFAVDFNIKIIEYAKRIVEFEPIPKNIIFICSDYLSIPIRENSINTIVDFFGSSNYASFNDGFLLEKMRKFYDNEAYFITSFAYFQRFSSNNPLNEVNRKYYRLSGIYNGLAGCNIIISDEEKFGYMHSGGKYESVFNKEDKIYCLALEGSLKKEN